MITFEQAMTEDQFHYGDCKRTVGPRGGVTEKVEHWWRNGQTQTWKTRPGEFRVPIKFGLRNYFAIDQHNADWFHVAADCPLNREDGEL